MQRTKSKILSILLSLVMLLSLLPTTALATESHPAVGAVSVDGGKSFGEPGKLYYKNGDSDATFTGTATDYNAAYDETTGVLTLQDYKGGSIIAGGATTANITIKLVGDNFVTGSVSSDMGGNITITSDSSGELSITNILSGNNTRAIGIAAGLAGSYQTGNVTIMGDAKVIISVTNDNNAIEYAAAYGIYAKENITISESASVDITCATPYNTTGGGNCNGLRAAKDVTIDTNGTIKIDVTNAGKDENNGYSFGVYPEGTATLTKVGNMEVQWKKGGNNTSYSGGAFTRKATFSDTDHAINVDETNCYASYRYSTSYYTVMVNNGTLTGPGVKYANGSGNFLAGDTVEIKPSEMKGKSGEKIPFQKWTSEQVTFTDPTAENNSFNVPANAVTVTAKHNPFVGAPTFTSIGATSTEGTLTFTTKVTLGDGNESFALVKEAEVDDTNKYNSINPSTTSPSSPYEYSSTVNFNNVPEGNYYVAEKLNGAWYLSEKFPVSYTAAPTPTATVADVTIDGTTGTAIADTDVVITLTNDKFKAIAADADVGGWFTNLPAGLEAKIKTKVNDDDTTATIKISGNPSVASSDALVIKIPAANLVSNTALTVTNNPSAKFAITAATGSLPAASVGTAPAAKTGLKYNGTEQELVDAGIANGGTMQYSLDNSKWGDAIPKGKNAGDYTVYYMVKGDSTHSDYTPVSNTVSVTIGQKDIADSTVTIDSIPNATYNNGTAITPNPVVKDGSESLTEGTDYTVSYTDNTNAGTATLTITGKGNYTGTKNANFTIDPANQELTVPGTANVALGTTLDLNTVCSSNAPGAVLTFARPSTSSLPTGTTFEESTGTVTAGNNTGSFEVTVNSAAVTNYKAALQKTITVYIVNKTPSSYATEPAPNTGLKYDGSEQELVTAGAANGGTVNYSLDGSSWSNTIPKGKDAKTYTVHYKIVGDATHSDSTPNTHTVTIGQKEVTVAAGDYKVSKEYDGTTTAGTGNGVLSVTGIVDSGVSVKATPVAYTDANVGGQSTMNVTIALDGTGKGNYKIKDGATTISVPCEITAKDVKLTSGINATNRSYVKDNTTVELTKGVLTFTGLAAGEDLDITVPATGTISAADAGNGKTVTYSGVTLKNGTTGKASNYTLNATLPTVTVNITKATAPTLPDISVSQKYTVTTEQSKDIGRAGMPADAGTLTYTKGTAATTGSVTVTSWDVDATGKVTYTLSGGAAGNTVTLPVTIESTNYVDATVKVVITLTKPSYSGGGGGGSSTPSYSITVDRTENGTITVSPKSASKGDTVTITVKPDKGYELDTLKVLDKNGDKVKLTEKNGKYTFTMPTGKVTVKGSFVEEAPVQIFRDVPVDAYYYEAVKWAAEKGITGGVGNGLFAPNQPCTRAQIVTFLWRAAGSPAPKNMSSFTDVPADAFYAKAVAWAVENGITGGTGDGMFSPDVTCTRAQSVTFLYRAAGSPAVSGSAEFGDVATNAYYADAVAWAAKNGITGGIGGGQFGSGNDCTRAQIVTFLYRNYQSK